MNDEINMGTMTLDSSPKTLNPDATYKPKVPHAKVWRKRFAGFRRLF